MIADADLCYYASKFSMSSWCKIMPKMLEFWISQQYNIMTEIYLRSPIFQKTDVISKDIHNYFTEKSKQLFLRH